MTSTNAAIDFHPEGYTWSTTGKLMGRQAAGAGFLRGFMQHARSDVLYCYAPNAAAAHQFAQLRDAHAPTRAPVRWIKYDELSALGTPGTLYLPGPTLAPMAWRRRRVGESSFSLCGVTHTIASHSAMDALADLLTAPVMPWDALICTSRAVLQSTQRLLAAEAEYLSGRLAARCTVWPRLALIPLGTECAAYATDGAARHEWRTRLGIGEHDVAFLFLGRLSFHAKANPFPMYVALQGAAQRTKQRIHLIQAGWFDNAHIEAQFRNGARALCPAVNTVFLDGRDAGVREKIWQAADVFISLSDNFQETFGLTPIEAMAAGLPAVVSDWDGYRDTVRDGVDGYRIPTLMPPAPAGQDLAQQHEDELDSYDRYIGFSSLAISVDIPACTEACVALAGNAELRRRMGNAARERARADFDWSVIIARYQALWQELGELRREAAQHAISPAAASIAHPRRADPFWLFAGYPSRTLAATDRIALAPQATDARLAELRGIALVGFGKHTLAGTDFCAKLIDRLGHVEDLSVAEALDSVPAEARQTAMRTLVWLHKIDLIRLRQAQDINGGRAASA